MASQWALIKAKIQLAVNDSLKNEVTEAVKDEMQSTISEVVYAAGTPIIYQRRGGNNYGGMGNPDGTGSLADKGEMKHNVVNGVLIIKNEAEPVKSSFGNLAYNIEYGYGARDRWYNQPRPFIQETRNNLKSNKAHVKALKDGLRKRLGANNVL